MQLRLTAPIFKTHNVYGGRQLAQLGLQNLARSGQHRDAVPLSLQSRGRQVGRLRSHTPLRAGSTPAPAIQFSTGREQELKDVLQTTSARSVTEPVHQFSKQGQPLP